MEPFKTRLALDASASDPAPQVPSMDFSGSRPRITHDARFRSPRFNLLHILNIRGSLDLDVLERRLLEIRRGHPSIAVCFDQEGNRLERSNGREEPEPLRFLDLEGLHTTAQKFSFTATLEELLNTKFDPQVGQLLRVYIVRWNKEDHSIVFLAHALAADARSLSQLSERLMELYRGDSPLEPFPSDVSQDNRTANGFAGNNRQRTFSYRSPGRTELRTSVPLDFFGERAPTLKSRNSLLATATASFVSHNERNPLPKPIRVRALSDKLENSWFDRRITTLLLQEGYGVQTKLGHLLTLHSAELTTRFVTSSDSPTARPIAELPTGNGVKAFALQVIVQEMVPSFSQTVGTLQFTSGEIRNALCDSDICVYLDQQGPLVRIFLNFESDLLNEDVMRAWLQGYEEVLARIAAHGIDETDVTENRLAPEPERPEPTPFGNFRDDARSSDNDNSITSQSVTVFADASGPVVVRPSTKTEKALARIWSDVLKLDNIGVNENFFDLGGHSLLAVKLFSQITNEFGVELSLNTLLEHGTIRELATLLETPQLVDPECRLVPLQASAARVRAPLFWIPGGRAISVLAFREVSISLGVDQPVYALESRLPKPGEPVLSVPMRAARYITLIRSIQPKGPYYLAGFCMGGMVAFEIAQQLKKQGDKVALLALVQASMPGFPTSRTQRLRLGNQHRWFLCKAFLKFIGTRYASKLVGISREKRQKVLDEVSKLILGWYGTSAQLPDETQITNTQIMYAYRPEPYEGNIHIVLAEDCYESAGISASLDPRRAWAGITKGHCVTHVLPGDHHSVLVGGNAAKLAERLRTLLDDGAKST